MIGGRGRAVAAWYGLGCARQGRKGTSDGSRYTHRSSLLRWRTRVESVVPRNASQWYECREVQPHGSLGTRSPPGVRPGRAPEGLGLHQSGSTTQAAATVRE
jgi:hypothetical protein